MISVESNYKLVIDLLSKNNSQTISPQEYVRYAILAQNDLFDVLRGSENLMKSTYGKSRKLDERLNPFRVKDPITFTNKVASKPTGYAQITAVYTNTFEPVRPVDEMRTAIITKDPLAEDYYYGETASQLTLVKGADFTGSIEYLRRPVDVAYGYTIVNGRAQYNTTGTVNFEWDKNLEMELTTRILQYAGLSMGSQLAIQYTQAKQQSE